MNRLRRTRRAAPSRAGRAAFTDRRALGARLLARGRCPQPPGRGRHHGPRPLQGHGRHRGARRGDPRRGAESRRTSRRAGMASDEHRTLALVPAWTHVGWGRSRPAPAQVWVMLFCEKLVEDLRHRPRSRGLTVSGGSCQAPLSARFCTRVLRPCSPRMGRRNASILVSMVPRTCAQAISGLASVAADGDFRLTNAFTWPPGTESPAASSPFLQHLQHPPDQGDAGNARDSASVFRSTGWSW